MDPSGVRAAQPFYEVRLQIAADLPAGDPRAADPLPADPPAAVFHGQSGRAKFRLPPQPLLRQGIRSLQQLIQERYQL